MIVNFFGLTKEEIAAIKAAMEKEHQLYFATDYGYTETYPEPAFPIKLEENEEYPCGYFSDKNFFGWLRAVSGAFLTVFPSTGEAIFSGRRHSLLTLLDLFPEISCLRNKPFEYIETRRQDLHPFKTTTHRRGEAENERNRI